ncbi:SMP-30/gluconolactonase/LRE family protein [Fretibacter rubidus]|uniref:SMP-30/gluconolactonase/LRE family protein n=1 Tax=Fretibacter rubidus TaxID=570162 RepID=UPI00352B7862
MMKKFLFGAGAVIALTGAYLTLWPVPIDPAPWDAEASLGYTGDFAPNTTLADMERIAIGQTYGPEDVAIREKDGGYEVYVSGHKGEIIKIDPVTLTRTTITNTGGVPLGIEFANETDLIVADAYLGLMSVNVDTGAVNLLTNSVDGTPILYADDVDIAPNGVIYFSDASTKFGAKAIGSTMAASLLEIMEHRKTGRVLSYDPRDGVTRVVADGFSFSNGVAMHPDGQSLLVVETGTYSVHRIWVDGPRKGKREVIIGNLPGFPDNINPGPLVDLPNVTSVPTFYVGLISQRSDWLDANARKPFMRKLAMRLPERLRPSAVDYTHIVQITADGQVIQTLQDPSGDYPQATGAVMAPDGHLYVSSLSATTLARKQLNPKN